MMKDIYRRLQIGIYLHIYNNKNTNRAMINNFHHNNHRLIPLLCFTLLITFLPLTLCESSEPSKEFIVQLTPMVDSKAIKSFNLTFSKNQSEPMSHTLTINKNNFKRNVSVKVEMFVWYNGGWVSKKPRNIQITDKKEVGGTKERLMLNLMKYRPEKSSPNYLEKSDVMLSSVNVYSSYDPEASLMVAQLENPEYFIPKSAYLKIEEIPPEVQRVNVTLNFWAMPKTNQFLENKRHLSELLEIQAKIREPLNIISNPFTKEMIQPMAIYENIKKNLNIFSAQQKKINEKISLLKHYKKYTLISGNLLNSCELEKYLPFLEIQLKKYKITYKDNIVPLYQWIFAEKEMIGRIQALRQAILGEEFPQQKLLGAIESKNKSNASEPVSLSYSQVQFKNLQQKDLVQTMSSSADLSFEISFYVGFGWILLDFLSYLTVPSSPGLSKSYGTFFNIWLIINLLSFSARIGLSSHGLLGLAVFVIGIVLHWIISLAIERRFTRIRHRGSRFDENVVSFLKNCIAFVMVICVGFHLFSGTKIGFNTFRMEGFQCLKRMNGTALTLLFWTFSELSELITEYYFLLTVLPQIFLSFKLKKTEKFVIIRILLLGAVANGRSYLWVVGSHWSEQLLYAKEGVLCLVMCLQFVLYLKSKKVEVLAVEVQKEEAKGSEKEVKNDEENKNESQERILEKEKNTSSKKQEKKM